MATIPFLKPDSELATEIESIYLALPPDEQAALMASIYEAVGRSLRKRQRQILRGEKFGQVIPLARRDAV